MGAVHDNHIHIRGGQLFGATNNNPLQSGLFLSRNLTATATTQLNRDIVTLTLNASNSSSTGASANSQLNSQSNGVILAWTHDLRPDMHLSSSASYATITGSTLGGSRSIAFNTSLIYNVTESVAASARYSFFKSSSANTINDLLEDLFVVGVSKQF